MSFFVAAVVVRMRRFGRAEAMLCVDADLLEKHVLSRLVERMFGAKILDFLLGIVLVVYYELLNDSIFQVNVEHKPDFLANGIWSSRLVGFLSLLTKGR